MSQPDTVTRILDSAERLARQGGYNAFSFRQIAAEIGVKPASIHYHFATKEDLGAALAERYADRFLKALGDPEEGEPPQLLLRYIDAYRAALVTDQLMCLCGMFGAEIGSLPDPVARQTRGFFERNLAWLERVFARATRAAPDSCAARTIATLEGGMILARAMGDMALFDKSVRALSAEMQVE